MKNYFYQHSDKADFRKKLRNQSTKEEIILWQHLKNKQLSNFKFTRQYSVGPYILDFYCAEKRLGIELDGSQHTEIEAQKYDTKRTEFIENLAGVRFWVRQNSVLLSL